MIKTLHTAKKAKNDEFYTQITDIEKEIKNYRKHFKGQVVFMNCDDPEWSNFWKFFVNNFHLLGIKKLISTHYEPKKPSYKLEYDGVETIKTTLKQNGDFRSPEAIELLKEADIVITNPPFSLFREYVAQLMAYNKKFLIMGNNNAITYKEVFAFIKQNRMWLGTHSNKTMKFEVPMDYPKGDVINGKKYGNVPAISWFTNLEHNKRNEEMFLFRSYTDPKMKYPKYDNYDAIEVSKVADIPKDYDGIMGVPITFLDKYNPNQFEIITLGVGEHNFTPTKKYGKFYDPITKEPTNHKRDYLLYVRDEDGKYLTDKGYRINKVYARVLIKRRENENHTN